MATASAQRGVKRSAAFDNDSLSTPAKQQTDTIETLSEEETLGATTACENDIVECLKQRHTLDTLETKGLTDLYCDSCCFQKDIDSYAACEECGLIVCEGCAKRWKYNA